MFAYAQATALITGASSGIGEAFAFALPRRYQSRVDHVLPANHPLRRLWRVQELRSVDQ
jgi:NADP-dependent 3-hydroxy acid dehydrogenase YdfG